MQTAHKNEDSNTAALLMALELSKKTWKVLFGWQGRRRGVSVPGGDWPALLQEVARARTRLGVPAPAPVMSVYEAGRDGHWLQRALCAHGVDTLEIDSASIEVDRRARRAKSDGIDVDKLLVLLQRHVHGEARALRVVRVPDPAAEARQHAHRERERLVKERTQLRNRIQGVLFAQGIRDVHWRTFATWLSAQQQWNGAALPASTQQELMRAHARLELLLQQLQAVERELEHASAAADGHGVLQQQLRAVRAIGPHTATVLVSEFFGWREFGSGKEVGAAAGLTPTPFDSGDSRREQGISKAGNRRVRTAMIELAWRWLLWQPDSELSQWFNRRFGAGRKTRSRRVGIVAVARRLLILLWRYLQTGELPIGVKLKTTPAT